MTEFTGLRIGFDAKRIFTNRSGLGAYSRNLVSSLKDLFPRNAYVLFTPEKKLQGIDFDEKGFEVITPTRLGIRWFASFWRNFQLAGQLKLSGVNLFHGLSNELPSGIHRVSIPSVVTIHDLIFLKFPELYRTVDRIIYRKKVTYACKHASRIIAVSHQTKKDLINILKVPEEKIEVVYQSVSMRFFVEHTNEKIKEIKEKYRLSENFILSVGTLEKRKNQLNLLRALKEGAIEQEVVLIGRGTKYSLELLEFIRANNMKKQVRFISDLPDEDLPFIYQLAGLSVYISKYEGFGIPLIEAMACGCPVITSSVSCLPETAGGAALLVDPDDIGGIMNGIKLVLQDDKVRAGLIEKGKERAKSFLPENAIVNLVTVYSGLLNLRNR